MSMPKTLQGPGPDRHGPRPAPAAAARRGHACAALCLAVLVLVAAGTARELGHEPGLAGDPQGAGPPRMLLAAQAVPAPGQWALPGGQAARRACPAVARGFPCVMRRHIRAAERYLNTQPGTIGIVLHDRTTGATWRNANAHTDFPAASTIKLAMAADLLLRHDADGAMLSGHDWNLIHQALHDSSDSAADRLWSAFEDGRFLRRISHFGMTSASFSATPPYWGYMYCSPEDLDNLMNYVLDKIPDGDRAYLLRQLRAVARIQQWGVWGAGTANRPGNKDGWEKDNGIWVTDTVGFAGPGARYTLAIMYIVKGQAGFRVGANTLTQVSALLFQGHRSPVPRAEGL